MCPPHVDLDVIGVCYIYPYTGRNMTSVTSSSTSS